MGRLLKMLKMKIQYFLNIKCLIISIRILGAPISICFFEIHLKYISFLYIHFIIHCLIISLNERVCKRYRNIKECAFCFFNIRIVLSFTKDQNSVPAITEEHWVSDFLEYLLHIPLTPKTIWTLKSTLTSLLLSF